MNKLDSTTEVLIGVSLAVSVVYFVFTMDFVKNPGISVISGVAAVCAVTALWRIWL